MKSWTIPKLELQAVVLAARLKAQVEKLLNYKLTKIFLRSDSMIVLQWLKGSKDKQPVFVGNHEGEILDLTTIDQWHHVPGELNPADIVTLGLSATELQQSPRLTGPNFLRNSDKGCDDLQSELLED